jgi:tungstate transport system ATP-binding protein
VSVIALEGVRVDKGGRPILDLPVLAVEEHEVLAVLGPTGAGKSTLLRVLGLLQQPSLGAARWRDEKVRWPAPLELRRRTAMAFQDALLFSGTVFDNVAYGLTLRGVRRAELAARVDQMLRAFRIEALTDRLATTLSGGEAQRVALARAVVLRPELLLLDEPLGSLDQPIRVELREELARIVRDHALTCVVVTHDQEEAFAIADRVAILCGGRLQQLGAPDDVLFRPATRAVAAFVLTDNVLPGRTTGRARGYTLVDIAGLTLQVRSDLPADLEVSVCVRPENVLLDDVTSGSGGASAGIGCNFLPATVVDAQPRGHALRVTLDCGFPLVAALPRRGGTGDNLRAGQPITVRLDAAAVHLIHEPEGTSNADA